MGRAFFSEKYIPVVVRTEPDLAPTDPYAKWSRWNYFDPDSDQFFDDAQRETFTDTQEYAQEQERIRNSVVLDGGRDSPASSEASEPASDSDSPMAVGPDDPAVIMADAHSPADWEHRFLTASAADPDWRRARSDRQTNDQIAYPHAIPVYIPHAMRNPSAEGTAEQARSRRPPRNRSATVSSVYLPPSSLRNSTTATEVNNPIRVDPWAQFRRANVTPIVIPNQPSTPGPISSDSPSTPTDNVHPPQTQAIFTPSPPPSVTPHLYTWNRRPLGIPPSPLVTQGPVGMLNPSARMSRARVNVIPTPMRVQNAAI